MKFVLKRDSKLEPFDQERITMLFGKLQKQLAAKIKNKLNASATKL